MPGNYVTGPVRRTYMAEAHRHTADIQAPYMPKPANDNLPRPKGPVMPTPANDNVPQPWGNKVRFGTAARVIRIAGTVTRWVRPLDIGLRIVDTGLNLMSATGPKSDGLQWTGWELVRDCGGPDPTGYTWSSSSSPPIAPFACVANQTLFPDHISTPISSGAKTVFFYYPNPAWDGISFPPKYDSRYHWTRFVSGAVSGLPAVATRPGVQFWPMPQIWEYPIQIPIFWPVNVPITYPIAPGATPRPNPNPMKSPEGRWAGNRQPRSRNDPRPQQRPLPRSATPSGTKERKGLSKAAGGIVGAIQAAYRGTGELLDALDAIHDALPKGLQARPGATPQEKAAALWKNADRIDINQAILNLLMNHYTDQIIGTIMAGATRTATAMGVTIGPYAMGGRQPPSLKGRGFVT